MKVFLGRFLFPCSMSYFATHLLSFYKNDCLPISLKCVLDSMKQSICATSPRVRLNMMSSLLTKIFSWATINLLSDQLCQIRLNSLIFTQHLDWLNSLHPQTMSMGKRHKSEDVPTKCTCNRSLQKSIVAQCWHEIWSSTDKKYKNTSTLIILFLFHSSYACSISVLLH